jgi:hypothetical protein
VPTLVWYGTHDVLSPPHHSEWIACTVAGASIRMTEPGHMGDPDTELTERLNWLTGART